MTSDQESSEIAKLKARIAVLESYLDKTADGALIVECEKLYCPKCLGEVVQHPAIAYCWDCPNGDSEEESPSPPLPLSYGSTLSKPERK